MGPRRMELLPVSEYDSDKARPTMLGELRAIYRYRDFLRLLVVRTIKSRYKRSVLGVAWTLLNPLLSMIVLTVAFAALFKGAIPRYPVYILIGLTAWNFFSQSTAFAMGQMFWGGSLMKRVYVPPTIFAVACILNGVVNLGFSLIPLAGIMLVFHQPFYATWWFVPLAVGILALFSLGVALLTSSLSVLFTDVMEMYQLLLQAWFFLTPVIYPPEIIAGHLTWALTLNPMAYMVELVRRPIYAGQLPDGTTVLVSLALALVTFLFGAWVFTKKSDEFAYRI